MRCAAAALLFVVAAMAIPAARGSPAPCQGKNAQIAITSTPETAGGRPLEVALVFVSDPALARKIANMKAHEYFAAGERLQEEFTRGFAHIYWQLQAGQNLPRHKIRAPCGVIATFLFANYWGAGAHRISLGRIPRGTVMLGAKDFAWAPDR